MNHAQFWGGGGAAPYEIEQSLRTGSDNQNLQRTLSASGNRRTWTWSGWIKRGEISAEQHFLESWNGSGDVLIYARFNSNDKIRVKQFDGSTNLELDTTAVFRDPSAWYHIVISFDTTQATASDRAKIYVNGELQSLSTATYPSQNYETFMNRSGYRFGLMGALWSTFYSRSFNGYMAEAHLIDGSALDPTSFGETNDDGVWVPVNYTGSHGTEGCYIKFDPTATNGIGHDHSGNGNNLTNNNFTTSGTGTDVMSDTPTNNFATLNPLIGYQAGGLLAPIYSNGNLTVAPQVNSGNNSRVASATLARNPADGGVWRWEMVVNNTNNSFYGIMAIDENYGSGNFGPRWGASGLGGTLSTSGGASANLQEQHATISAGDVITIVVSFDDNEIGWYINGTRDGFYNGCNFSDYDQLVPFFKESTRTQTPCTFDVNFGQKAFQYTISGDAWGDLSTLPAPTVKDGSKNFNTVTYTGDGTSSNAITGVGFQPDWLWIKKRNATENHNLFDVLRGVDISLQSNNTNAEFDAGITMLSSFDTDGFTLGSNGGVNANTHTFVAWNWLAGGSGSSNTDGSITSTVSANPSAGFSIVGYEGNNTAGATVGHGLGVPPSMIIIKNRDNSAGRWIVYHNVFGGTKYIRLDGGGLPQTDSSVFNNTAPSSTTFTLGTNYYVNGNTENIIAYCFAEVEGFSKIGSFVGNGNADGPFIHTGFSVSWLLIKNTTTAQGWYLNDSARNPYNLNYLALFPANSGAESASTGGAAYDFLSNGFKPRTGNNDSNGLNDTYIYMAFGSSPFGGEGVSPATAK